MKSFSSSDGCSIRGVPYLQASQPTKKFPRRAIEQLICALPNKLYGVQERKSQLSADNNDKESQECLKHFLGAQQNTQELNAILAEMDEHMDE